MSRPNKAQSKLIADRNFLIEYAHIDMELSQADIARIFNIPRQRVNEVLKQR